MFMALALCMPEAQVYLYFLIPVKMKWMFAVYIGFSVFELYSYYYLDKESVLDSTKQEVKLIDRGIIYLTGIDKIVRFDNEEFYMESVMGPINVKGDMLEVVKLDTKYITEWTFGLDIKILLKTVLTVFMGSGAR